MKPDELPLLELFTRLRQAGLPLGMTEYQLVMKGLQSGFGIPDRQALARLCSTLWVKSKEDQLLFNYHFEQVMAEDEANLASVDELQQLPQTLLASPETDSLKISLVSWWRKISLPIRFAMGGTMVVATSFSLWVVRPKCPYFISDPLEIVEEDQDYRYEIEACKTNPEDQLEISVLQNFYWLEFQDNKDGTALLSGEVPAIGEFDRFVNYTVNLWDIQGNQITSLDRIDNIHYLDFTPDGELFLIEQNGQVRLWNSQGNLLSSFVAASYIRGVSVSQDGEFFVTWTEDQVHLWDRRGNEQDILDNSDDIQNIRLSPDGKLLVTFENEGQVRLLDRQGNQIANLGSSDNIRDIRFSPDGELLVTWTADRASLWDRRGSEQKVFDNSDNIRNASFSPDGELLVTWTRNQARLWDRQGNQIADLIKDNNIGWVYFSPDGELLVTWTGNQARLWDRQGNEQNIFDNSDSIQNIYFSPDGELIVTWTGNQARLWDRQGNEQNLFDDSDNIWDIHFSPDGQYFVTFEKEGQVRLRNRQGDLLNTFGDSINTFGDSDNIWNIRFSPDEQRFITTTRSDEITLKVTDSSTNRSNTQTFKLVSYRDISAFQARLGRWLIRLGYVTGPLICFILPGAYIVARWVAKRNEQSLEFPSLPEPDKETSTSISALNQGVEDEVQVAQAVQQKGATNSDLPSGSFTEISEYFPLTGRQMKQSWRYLRRLIREGPPVELDVAATINQVSRGGMLLYPVLRPRRVNRNELLLLVQRQSLILG